MPDRNQKISARRTAISAAVVAAMASMAVAVEVKPGDIIFGTSQNNPAGAGRLYVYDPINNTVTRIGGDFGNGIGGLALDNNYNLIVGTTTVNTSSSGRLFSVDPTTGNSTQLGSSQFFNGVGGLAYDPASGDIYVGTKANSTSGQGQLLKLEATNNYAASQFGSQSFANGVTSVYYRPSPNGTPTMYIGTGASSNSATGRLYSVDVGTQQFTAINDSNYPLGYYNGVEDIAADRDGNNVVFGTGANNPLGAGNLFSFDPLTQAATKLGGDYLNRVSSLAYDFDGQLYLGTNTNGAATGGHLYSVDPIAGVATQIVPSNFSADIFNGVTAMIAVQPLPDFVGGNNVVIGSSTTLSMFNQTSPVDGSINWFSGTTNQSISLTDVYGSLEVADAGVRTGSGLPNTEQGDLTLAEALDFDGSVTGTTDTRTLTLRAADDLVLNGAIGDSDTITSAESLNLNLYARNERRVVLGDAATGIDLLNGDDVAGKLDINAPINLGGGNLYAYGVAFDNTETGATITTTGNATIDFRGDVTISQPLVIGGDVAINAGQFANTVDGTISADPGVAAPVNSLTIVATAGEVEGVSYDGSITLNGQVLASTFAFSGVDFTNNTPIDAVNGSIAIMHSGVVTLNASIHASTTIDITGSSFDNPSGTILADDALTVTIDGPVTFSNSATAASISTAGTDLTINAGIDSTTGGIAFEQSGATAINASVLSATDVMINQAILTPGSVNIAADVTTGSGGNFASRGTTFDSTAAINVTGSATIDHSDAVNIGAALGNASSVSITGSEFANTNGPITSTGAIGITTLSGNQELDAAISGDTITLNAANEINSTPTGTLSANGIIDLAFANATLSGDITAGSLNSNGGGITFNGVQSINAGDFTLNQTGATDINGFTTVNGDLNINQTVGQTASVDIDAPVEAGALRSQGTTFRSSESLTLSGEMVINHSDTVTIDGSIASPSSVTVNASDFANSQSIETTGDANFVLTGKSAIDAAITAGTFSSQTSNGDTSGAFETTGLITTTTGGLIIDHPQSPITIGGGISSTGDITLNPNGGSSNIALNSGVSFAAPGNLLTNGNDFVTDASGTIDGIDTSIMLNQSGVVNVGGNINIGVDLTSNGASTFDSTGEVTVGNDLTLNHSGQVITIGGAMSAGRDLTLNQPHDTFIHAATTVGRDFTLSGVGSFASDANGTIDVTGITAVTLPGNVDINGTMQIGPMTIDAANLTTTATITGTGAIGLTIGDGITLGADVTTTGASSDLTATSNTFDSRGATLDIGGLVDLQQSSTIITDAVTAAQSMTLNASSIEATVGSPLTTLGGNMQLTSGSNVTLGGGASVAGDLTSTGTTFDSTGADTDASTAGVVATGLIDINHSGAVTTSALDAGTTLTINAPSLVADGFVKSGSDTTVTATGGDVAASNGVDVGGDLAITANTVADQNLSTVGGDVTVAGRIDISVSGSLSTNSVAATAGPIVVDTGASSLANVDGNLTSGDAITVATDGFTVTGNTTAANTVTINANDSAVVFGGDTTVTGGGNLDIDGGNTVTSGGAAQVDGSTDINTSGNVDLNTLVTGTTLDVLTNPGSTFTSNDLTIQAGATNITAPAGITLNGPVNANGVTTLTALDGLVDINAQMNVTNGSLTVNATDFNNADNGATTVAGDVQFNNTGSVYIGQDLTSAGTNATIGFADNPIATLDQGATVSVASGLMNFSGGVQASAINESRINSQTGYVGSVTSGDVVLDGGEDESVAEVIWHNTGNLYVGGSATSGVGDGTLLVHQNACLIVDGTLKVWANDTLTLLDGKVRFSNLDLDNQRGNFIWYSGTINDTDNLTISPLQQIAKVIGVGSGATQTLRVLPDRHLEVNGNTNLQTTLYLDGGVLSTGTLQSGSKLNFISGTLNVTNDNFYVVPSQKPAGWTQDGTLGNRTVTISEGQSINVSGTGRTTTIARNGLLQVAGGEFNAANGMTNNGTIALQAAAGRVYGSGVTNTSTGLIYGTGQIDAPVTNAGELRSSFFEVLKLNGQTNTSTGTIRLVNGGTIEAPAGITSSGVINGDGSLIVGQWDTVNDLDVTGSGLRSTGSMNFAAKTDLYGDVKISGGGAAPKLISSGGAVTTFYDDLVVYDYSVLQTGANSTIVYFGTLKGDYILQGTGHVIEGTESPGFSPGFALSTGDRTYADGSTAVFYLSGDDRMEIGLGAFSLGGRDGRYTAIDTQGLLSIAPGVNLDVQLFETTAGGSVYRPLPGSAYELMQFGSIAWLDGASPDSINWNLPALGNGLSWKTTWTDTSLSLAVIPEPTSLTLVGLAAGGLLRRRRRCV